MTDGLAAGLFLFGAIGTPAMLLWIALELVRIRRAIGVAADILDVDGDAVQRQEG